MSSLNHIPVRFFSFAAANTGGQVAKRVGVNFSVNRFIAALHVAVRASVYKVAINHFGGGRFHGVAFAINVQIGCRSHDFSIKGSTARFTRAFSGLACKLSAASIKSAMTMNSRHASS